MFQRIAVALDLRSDFQLITTSEPVEVIGTAASCR
jgi:hypothetical protein